MNAQKTAINQKLTIPTPTNHGTYGNASHVRSIIIGTWKMVIGEVSVADGNSVTVTLPVSFQDAGSWQIGATQYGNVGSDPYVNGWKILSKSANTFVVRANTNGTNTFCFIAMGV